MHLFGDWHWNLGRLAFYRLSLLCLSTTIYEPAAMGMGYLRRGGTRRLYGARVSVCGTTIIRVVGSVFGPTSRTILCGRAYLVTHSRVHDLYGLALVLYVSQQQQPWNERWCFHNNCGKRRLHGLDLILFVCLQTSLVASILSACLLGSRFALCSAGCGHNATFPPIIIIIFIIFRLNVPQLQQAAMC